MQQTTLVADQISSSTLKQKLQQENQQIHSQSKDILRIFHIINKNFRHRAIEKNDVLGQELCWVFFSFITFRWCLIKV